jgi:putative flippase GtrA
MRDRLIRLWRLYHTPTGKKMIRYSAVSVISAAVSFSVLGLTYGVLRLWTEVPCALFANTVAGFPSYYLNRRWVWGKSGRSHIVKEVVPFWSTAAAGMVLAIFAAAEAHHLGSSYHLGHLTRTALVLGANLGAWGALWVLRFFILNVAFRPAGTPAQLPQPDLVEAL